MTVRHEYVDSSTISTIGYDPEDKTLYVAFHGGGRYTYHDVPQETYEALMDSESKGQFLHKNVKNIHRFVKR